LYEQLPSKAGDGSQEKDVEQPGTKVTRTQWLDLSSLEMANLIGKNILIVDEVDDTRTTLEYAVKELMKDVEAARKLSGRMGDEGKTKFSIFVLHVSLSTSIQDTEGFVLTNIILQNKDKPKRGQLPEDLLSENRKLLDKIHPHYSIFQRLIPLRRLSRGCDAKGHLDMLSLGGF